MLKQKKIALGCILISFFSCNDSKDNISEPNRIEVKVDSIVPLETSDNLLLGIYEKNYFYQEDIKNVPFNIDSSASIDRFSGGWTNGHVWFGIQESDSVISLHVEGVHPFVGFVGGNRHEGGYNMSGVLINDSSIFVLGSNISPVEKGDLLVQSIFFDKKCIVVFDREGAFKDVLIDSKESIGNDEGILIQESLAGKFYNMQTNDTIEFFANGASVIWNGVEMEFILEIGEYEQLANVFTLSSKEENSLDQELTTVVSYAFERSGVNLSLIRAYFDEEEGDMAGWTASGDTLNFTLIEKSKELSMNQFKKNVFAAY